MRPAAIGLVWDDRGRLLAISRPEPPHEMAIPGGEIEVGETAERAFIREVEEETGVLVRRPRLLGLMRSPTDGRTIHVFEAREWSGFAFPKEYPGDVVKWMWPADLVAQGVHYRLQLLQILQGRRR